MNTPKPPQEDPKLVALRNAEQARSEEDRLKSIQDQTALETRFRSRQFGMRSLLGALTGGRPLRSLLGAG